MDFSRPGIRTPCRTSITGGTKIRGKVQCQPGIAEIAMLRLLSVTNFATIEQLEMELASGFNVLTGETGAGKSIMSIIVDALSLLLGARADGGMVRSGARQSRVEGVFLLNGDLVHKISGALGEYEIDDNEEELILAREVNIDGRNTCRVNGANRTSQAAEHLVRTPGGRSRPKSAFVPFPCT